MVAHGINSGTVQAAPQPPVTGESEMAINTV